MKRILKKLSQGAFELLAIGIGTVVFSFVMKFLDFKFYPYVLIIGNIICLLGIFAYSYRGYQRKKNN